MSLLKLFVNYAYIEVVDYLIKNVKPDSNQLVDQPDHIDWSAIKKSIFSKRRYIFPDFTLVDYIEILKDVKIYDDATKVHTDYGDVIAVLNTYWFIIGESINETHYPYLISEYRTLYHPMEI